jgi:hypothetical protein
MISDFYQNKKHLVSSAYITNEIISLQFSMSLIYMRKSSGPRIDPCGTPVDIVLLFDLWLPILTICVLLYIK